MSDIIVLTAHLIQDLKLSWQINVLKYSQVISRVNGGLLHLHHQD
jgi:hypothetical protein